MSQVRAIRPLLFKAARVVMVFLLVFWSSLRVEYLVAFGADDELKSVQAEDGKAHDEAGDELTDLVAYQQVESGAWKPIPRASAKSDADKRAVLQVNADPESPDAVENIAIVAVWTPEGEEGAQYPEGYDDGTELAELTAASFVTCKIDPEGEDALVAVDAGKKGVFGVSPVKNGEGTVTFELADERSEKLSIVMDLTVTGVVEVHDIAEATAELLQASVPYTGEGIDAQVKVEYDGAELSADTDYEVTYEAGEGGQLDDQGRPLAAGSYTVTIAGIGNYTGTKVLETPLVVEQEEDPSEGGEPSEGGASSGSSEPSGGDEPSQGSEPSGESEPSEGSEPSGGSEPPAEEKRSIEDATIAPIEAQEQTGHAIEPTLTVTYGTGDEAETLKLGEDYSVSYKDNVDVGTATATVTGQGAYTGSKSVSFQIVAKQPERTVLDTVQITYDTDSDVFYFDRSSGESGELLPVDDFSFEGGNTLEFQFDATVKVKGDETSYSLVEAQEKFADEKLTYAWKVADASVVTEDEETSADASESVKDADGAQMAAIDAKTGLLKVSARGKYKVSCVVTIGEDVSDDSSSDDGDSDGRSGDSQQPGSSGAAQPAGDSEEGGSSAGSAPSGGSDDSGESGDSGNSAESGSSGSSEDPNGSGDSGSSGGSGDSGESSETGGSGETGESGSAASPDASGASAGSADGSESQTGSDGSAGSENGGGAGSDLGLQAVGDDASEQMPGKQEIVDFVVVNVGGIDDPQGFNRPQSALQVVADMSTLIMPDGAAGPSIDREYSAESLEGMSDKQVQRYDVTASGKSSVISGQGVAVFDVLSDAFKQAGQDINAANIESVSFYNYKGTSKTISWDFIRNESTKALIALKSYIHDSAAGDDLTKPVDASKLVDNTRFRILFDYASSLPSGDSDADDYRWINKVQVNFKTIDSGGLSVYIDYTPVPVGQYAELVAVPVHTINGKWDCKWEVSAKNQQTTDGKPLVWTELEGETGQTLRVLTNDSSVGNWYRVTIDNNTNLSNESKNRELIKTSEPVKLEAAKNEPRLVLSYNPPRAGDMAIFKSSIYNYDGDVSKLEYVWEWSEDGGVTWNEIKGEKKSTLKIQTEPVSDDGSSSDGSTPTLIYIRVRAIPPTGDPLVSNAQPLTVHVGDDDSDVGGDDPEGKTNVEDQDKGGETEKPEPTTPKKKQQVVKEIESIALDDVEFDDDVDDDDYDADEPTRPVAALDPAGTSSVPQVLINENVNEKVAEQEEARQDYIESTTPGARWTKLNTVEPNGDDVSRVLDGNPFAPFVVPFGLGVTAAGGVEKLLAFRRQIDK